MPAATAIPHAKAQPHLPFARFVQGLSETYSNQYIGDVLGVSGAHVSDLKTGKKRPSAQLVARIRERAPKWYPEAIKALAAEGLAIPLEVSPDRKQELRLAVLLGMRWGEMNDDLCRQLADLVHADLREALAARAKKIV